MQRRVGVHESLLDGETILDSFAISFKKANNHADELKEPKHIVWISTKLVESGGNFPNPNVGFSCNTVRTLPIYIHNQAVMHERAQKVCLTGQSS